jgi:hypothetical protein
VDRYRHLAAVAWAAVITAALVTVTVSGLDLVANVVVWGTAAVGGALALLGERRRSRSVTP